MLLVIIFAANSLNIYSSPLPSLDLYAAALEGGRIKVDVSISGNPGIAGFKLTLNFNNSVIVPASILKGSSVPPITLTSNLDGKEDMSALHYVTALVANTSNWIGNGVLFTVFFDILNEGDLGLSISYSQGDITNQRGEEINPLTVNVKEEYVHASSEMSFDGGKVSGSAIVLMSNAGDAFDSFCSLGIYDPLGVLEGFYCKNLTMPNGYSIILFDDIDVTPKNPALPHTARLFVWSRQAHSPFTKNTTDWSIE